MIHRKDYLSHLKNILHDEIERMIYQSGDTTLNSATEIDYQNEYNEENRNKFQKHKLDTVLESFDPNVSEWKNMENHKFFRIFDCGNLVYKLTS